MTKIITTGVYGQNEEEFFSNLLDREIDTMSPTPRPAKLLCRYTPIFSQQSNPYSPIVNKQAGQTRLNQNS